MNNRFNLITILGPTAVGKTAIAARLADFFNGEIISADSRQVYKGMDIGTGKDLQDYLIGSKLVPYHLIDVITPEKEFNLYNFTSLFYNIFSQISQRSRIPFLVGGTGLYLNAILSNYNIAEIDYNNPKYSYLKDLSDDEIKAILLKYYEKIHNKHDFEDRERMIKRIITFENKSESKSNNEIQSLTIGIKTDREVIKRKITERLKERLKSGMIEEVEELVKQGITFERLFCFGLEYRYVSLYLKGEINYNDMYQKLNSEIHQFAKRQMTWYRKMERDGIKINWFESGDFEGIKKLIKESLGEK